MFLIVCGGRDVSDRDWVWRVLDGIHRKHGITRMIEGGQRKWCCDRREYIGADWFAKCWREARGVDGESYLADWGAFGRGAGPRRNSTMAATESTHCLGFGGNSGTSDMLEKAERAGKITRRIFPVDTKPQPR